MVARRAARAAARGAGRNRWRRRHAARRSLCRAVSRRPRAGDTLRRAMSAADGRGAVDDRLPRSQRGPRAAGARRSAHAGAALDPRPQRQDPPPVFRGGPARRFRQRRWRGVPGDLPVGRIDGPGRTGAAGQPRPRRVRPGGGGGGADGGIGAGAAAFRCPARAVARTRNTYTTLVFGTGPNRPDKRANLDAPTVLQRDYLQESAIKLARGTNSATDVVVYATGVGAERFRGSLDHARVFTLIRSAADF